MRDALIIPTYDFVTPQGGRGTKARVKVAGDLINKGVVAKDCIVPFPQEVLPEGKELELIGPVSLGKNVANYVRSLYAFKDATVNDLSASNGTFDDTIQSLNDVFFEMQDIEGADGVPTEPVHVHFVSDWSQLGRLWLIWHIAYKKEVKKLGWKASFHLVPNFRTTRDILFHEPPAYLKCLWLSVHWRYFVL